MYPIITKEFETFNNYQYENRKDKNSTVLREFLKDGTYIEMDVSGDKQKVEFLKDNYFNINKFYYKNNNIKLKGAKEFENIITNKLIQKNESEFHSIQSNIFYHLIFANYYNLHEDTQNELLNLEKTIEIFDLNLYYKQENPLDYISVYIRIIYIYKKSDSISFYNKIEGLHKFDNILDFQKRVAKERIFFHTYQAEPEYSIFI